MPPLHPLPAVLKNELGQPPHQLRLAPAARCRSFSLLLPERESSGMSAEAVVQDHGAVRTVGLATSEAVTGDREDACSISAVGDNGVSSGDCRDAVSSDVYEEICA
jgi:hypothetical protein